MEEKNTFFSATKEKVYIATGFLAIRLLIGYVNRINLAAKIPFFLNMLIAAIDFIVSLPMKLVFATPALARLVKNEVFLAILFVAVLAYWYLFACILVYAYDVLNTNDDNAEKQNSQKQREENKEKDSEEKEEIQSKLSD